MCVYCVYLLCIYKYALIQYIFWKYTCIYILCLYFTAPVKIKHFLLLLMFKTVVLLNIFVETIIFDE